MQNSLERPAMESKFQANEKKITRFASSFLWILWFFLLIVCSWNTIDWLHLYWTLLLLAKLILINKSENWSVKWSQLKSFSRRLKSLSHSFVGISEAVVQRCSVEKVFLEILQNSQENTCTRVSFLIKLQTYGLLQNTSSGCFWNFYDGSCFVLFFLKGQCLWASRGILQPSRTFAMDFFCENS